MSSSFSSSSSSSSSSSPPSREDPIGTRYDSFVKDTPLVTRYVLTAQIASFLLDVLIFGGGSWSPVNVFALGTIPKFVVFRFELYRLVACTFLCTDGSFISIVFVTLSFLDYGKRLERSMGSAPFAYQLLMMSVIVNAAFTIIVVALWIVLYGAEDGGILFMSSYGMWPVLIGLIAMDCARASRLPDPALHRRRFLIWTVHALYYPPVLWVVFGLLSGGGIFGLLSSSHQLSLLLGMLLGYGCGFGRAEGWWKLPPSRGQEWENTLLRNFAARPGWVSIHSASGNNEWAASAPESRGGGGGRRFTTTRDGDDDGTSVGPTFPSSGGRTLGSGGATAASASASRRRGGGNTISGRSSNDLLPTTTSASSSNETREAMLAAAEKRAREQAPPQTRPESESTTTTTNKNQTTGNDDNA